MTYAGRNHRIEAFHGLPVQNTVLAARKALVMMVKTHGVVADPREVGDVALGVLHRRIVRLAYEIDPVETLLHARQPLELEMSALRLKPAMLSGGRVLKTLRGEVERTAWHDVVSVLEPDPSIALLDDVRFKLLQRKPLRCGKRHVPFNPVAHGVCTTRKRVSAW